MGSLGDGRDVDEEHEVIRLKEMEEAVGEEPELEAPAPVTEGSSFSKGAVIGKAPEENLSNFVLSWTLEDVLNKDLLKEKVNNIPETFTSAEQYLSSFCFPLIEEIREDLCTSLKAFSQSLFTKILSIKEIRKGKEVLYEIIVDSRKLHLDESEAYIPKQSDIFVLSEANPRLSSITQNGGPYISAWVVNANGTNVTFRTLQRVEVTKYIEILNPRGSLFAVFLVNMIPSLRIWRALELREMMYESRKIFNDFLDRYDLRSRPEHNHSGRDLYNHSNECEDHGKLKRKQGETDEQESHVCRKPRFNCENWAHSFHYREHCLGSECHRDSQATETRSSMEGEARYGSTATKKLQYTPSTGEFPVSQQADIQTNNRSIPKVPSPTRNRGCHNRFSQYPDTNFGTTQPQWSRTGSDVWTQRESSTRDISCSRPTQSPGYRREDSTRDINSSRPTQSPDPRGLHHQGEPWYRKFYVDDQNRMCGRVKPLGRSWFNSNNQSHYERPPQVAWDGPSNVPGNTPQRGGFRRTQRSINRDRQHSFFRNQKVLRLEQVIGHEGSKDSSSWGEWPECGNHGVIRHKQSVGSWGEWPVSGKQGVIGHEESLASSSRWEWPASGKQGVIGQISSSRGGWPENVKQEIIRQEESVVPSLCGEWPENLKQEVIGQEEYVVSSSRGG